MVLLQALFGMVFLIISLTVLLVLEAFIEKAIRNDYHVMDLEEYHILLVGIVTSDIIGLISILSGLGIFIYVLQEEIKGNVGLISVCLILTMAMLLWVFAGIVITAMSNLFRMALVQIRYLKGLTYIRGVGVKVYQPENKDFKRMNDVLFNDINKESKDKGRISRVQLSRFDKVQTKKA